MAKSKPAPVASATPHAASRLREAEDDPHRLAAVYLRDQAQSSTGRVLRFWRDQFWEFDGRCYRVVPDADLRAEVTREVKRSFDRWAKAAAARVTKTHGKQVFVMKVTTSLIRNVIQALGGLVLVPASVEQPAWIGRAVQRTPMIAMANGLIDLDRLIACEPIGPEAPSADWFSRVCLDYPYEPGATCPRFQAFLEQIFEGDPERIALVWEWFGYLLTSDTSLEKFLIAVGEGANGKSVLVNVLIALLGGANVSSVPLELFGVRFQLTMTLGMLANIASEIGETDRVAEATLKAYVSGNRMFFDRKHLPGVEACPTARLMFTTNTLPRFRDKSNGVWRRAILLPFNVVIPEDQRDLQLSDKLKVELPGIFNLAIEGLRRLRQQGRFTEPTICRQALEEHRTDTNPARAFLQEFVQARPWASWPCADLYQAYVAWSESNGFQVLDERQFGKEVVRQFPSVKRRRGQRGLTGSRPYVYDGAEYVPSGMASAPSPVVRARGRRPTPVAPPPMATTRRARRVDDLNLKDEALPTAGQGLPRT